MNVTITPELEAFIDRAVESGRFSSKSEAVAAGLRLLEEREAKFQALKRDIEIGMASPSAGLFDQAAAEDIKRRGRERLARLRAAE